MITCVCMCVYVCVPELSGIVTQEEGNNGRIRVSSESVMPLRHRPFLSFRVFSKNVLQVLRVADVLPVIPFARVSFR
jgi:hypothetical protein